MLDDRRNRVPGGALFFTVDPRDRHDSALVDIIGALRRVARIARARRPFHIDAWVVPPDHMHCLRTLPPDDSDFPTRWQEIKANFSRSRPRVAHRSAVRARRAEVRHA